MITVGLWITVHDNEPLSMPYAIVTPLAQIYGKLTICREFNRSALEGFVKVYPNQLDDVSIMTLFDLT